MKWGVRVQGKEREVGERRKKTGKREIKDGGKVRERRAGYAGKGES